MGLTLLPGADGEDVGGDQVAPGEDGGPLNDVLQFPDVAGPAVVLEGLESLRREPADILPDAAGVLGEKVERQGLDVLAPLPQGGEGDGDDVEPVVEVFPEAPGLDLLGKILVGCGHEADVDAFRGGGPHGDELSLLDDPQELCLDRGGDVADLVQEQGAAVGLLQEPLLGGDGAGEGTAHVAEELALQERVRQGRAVDGEEPSPPALAVHVDRPGDELFAGTRFAQDQDVGVAGGHLDGQVVDFPELLAGEDDVVRRVGA